MRKDGPYRYTFLIFLSTQTDTAPASLTIPPPQDPQPPRLTFFPLFSFMNFLIGPIPKNVLQLTLVLLTLPCRCLSFPCLLRRIAIKSFVTEYNIPRYITRWDAKIQEHKITKSQNHTVLRTCFTDEVLWLRMQAPQWHVVFVHCSLPELECPQNRFVAHPWTLGDLSSWATSCGSQELHEPPEPVSR